MNLSAPNLSQQLSFSRALTSSDRLFLVSKLSNLSLLQTLTITPKTTIIRMGGGPRTYPGGVSKWQWKRMQAKKAKQLLKARLCRERQIYEMRKRAELKAAVSELERPWEVVERAPNLFSVKADEQLKVLADRFQKPGGFDLWTERDGPQLFETPDELPSARFFPKGIVHSVKPYRRLCESVESDRDEKGSDALVENEGVIGGKESGFRNNRSSSVRKLRDEPYDEEESDSKDVLAEIFGNEEGSDGENSMESLKNDGRNGRRKTGRPRKNVNRKKLPSRDLQGSTGINSGLEGSNGNKRESNLAIRNNSRGYKYNRQPSNNSRESRKSSSEVYDMSMQKDGSYGFLQNSGQSDSGF